MAYFKYFNNINYDVRGVKNNANIDVVTNILKRVRLKVDFLNNRAFFAQIQIVDGQTPEYIAYKYYGDSELHWIVLYAKKATNPYYDWPLDYFALKKFVDKKYGADKINDTHHYEDADKYEVDSTASGATAITNFVYEERLNDNKRNLTIIRPEFVRDVVKELKQLLK